MHPVARIVADLFDPQHDVAFAAVIDILSLFFGDLTS
jgi:hypothetical protein